MAAAEIPMQGSLGHIIWTVCYLSVLIGLSAYGVHRYFIIYLYLKNRKREPVPARYFDQLPKVTVQLPIFNEVYVVERLLRSVSELEYPRHLLQIQVLDDSTDDTGEIVSSCADELRRRGRFFNFNGTAGLWRRSCIEESGGWQHDTLCEDLDLSYRAQLAGWKFIFLADVVTPAELPVDMNGFKSQQHRWTKGSVQTCKKLLPTIWRSPLPFFIKVEATGHLMSNFAYLLLAFLCLLLHPSSGAPSGGWLRTLLIDVPIFLAASVSVAVFYVCAQRELHPRTWMKEILFLPCLLALGVGLSLNNARAVLEAIFNHKSDFTRTPKYGIERKSQPWRSCKYRPLKSALPLAELGFAIYFTYFLWFAIAHRQFLSVPFLLVFQGGFLYVCLCSFTSRWPKISFGGSRTAAVILA